MMFVRKDMKIFFIGAICGSALFIAIYGYNILDFTNIGWIYNKEGSDFFQHQIGFDFFRSDIWHFPIGVYKNYAYPQGTSIVYTDSIPLFAIMFKIIRNFLPENFQYFGIWGIFSYSMSGGLSSVILYKYIKNFLCTVIVIPFLVCSTGVLWRLYAHSSLAGHWIILLALMVFLNRNKDISTVKCILIWSSITSLSVSIHSYFLIMVGCIMVAYLIDDYNDSRNLNRTILVLIVSIISTLLIFYLIGGFIRGGNVSEEGLGEYSMNLNSLINSQGYSSYIKELPIANAKQYEGFQYLGLGLIILLFICMTSKLDHFPKVNKIFLKNFIKKNCGLIFLIISLTLLALSPQITLNQYSIFDYSNVTISKILSPFRSTGRLFWPIWYLIVFYIIIVLFHQLKKTTYIFLMCFCLVIQFSDLKPLLIQRSTLLKGITEDYKSPLQSSFWDQLAGYNHINLLSNALVRYEPLAIFASHNNMTLNNGYIARRDFSLISKNITECLKNLSTGKISNTDLYIIPEEELYNKYYSTTDQVLKLYVDQYYVYLKNEDNERFEEYLASPESETVKIPEDIIYETQLLAPPINASDQKILFTDIKSDWETEHKLLTITGKLKNLSNVRYLSYAIFTNPMSLSYHIERSDGNNVLYDNERYYFDSIILPNDTVEFKISISMEGYESGCYNIILDCLQEGISWFSSQSQNIENNPSRIVEVNVE